MKETTELEEEVKGRLLEEEVRERLRNLPQDFKPQDVANMMIDEFQSKGLPPSETRRLIEERADALRRESDALKAQVKDLEAQKIETENNLSTIRGVPRLRWREFIEDLAQQGVQDPAVGNNKLFMPDEYINEIVRDTRVFVFPKFTGRDNVHVYDDKEEFDSAVLYLPFKQCWFECTYHEASDGVITYERYIQEVMLSTEFGDTRYKFRVLGLFVEEIRPGMFSYILYTAREINKRWATNVVHYNEGLDKTGIVPMGQEHLNDLHYSRKDRQWRTLARSIIVPLLEEFQKSALGTVSVNEKFKIKSAGSGEKLFPKIRRIVHVVPKKLRGRSIPGESREVDWSHRWLVRGHWMTFWKDKEKGIVDMTKIGKNREGEYCVYGYTWREESVKGPEDKPLIADKTRVVKNA